MKDFIENILIRELENKDKAYELFKASPLLRYLDSKMGAIYGDSKTRRSLANIYAVYSILYFYTEEYYNKPIEYKQFIGYEYTKLFYFYRSLYGGSKLQNHALNSRVNGEFKNKIVTEFGNDLIIINDGRYALHIDYLYVNKHDISKIARKIIEEYIDLLKYKDNKLIRDIEALIKLDEIEQKKEKLKAFLNEDSEARIFEILSYAILKNHYSGIKIFIGSSREDLKEEFLTLYKTGRTNANDGGIDFVMKPLGRFFQVTEVSNYDKYLLDVDKVMHFPITFIVKTKKSKDLLEKEINDYIDIRSGGMEIIKSRYQNAIEEIITINELEKWLIDLKDKYVNNVLNDIDLYYKLELNISDEW